MTPLEESKDYMSRDNFEFEIERDPKKTANFKPLGKCSEGDFSSQGSTDKSTEQTWPPQGNLLIVVLCLINLFANSAYSSIAPFYPISAVEKGVPPGVLGFIFSAYSVSMAVFSPLFAHLLYTVGAKRVLFYGCLAEGIAMVVFGLFYYIEDALFYATASFLCRMLEGFGNGCLNSGSAKVIMMMFPEKKLARLTGILQTFTGLGMLCGPILGSMLYSIGGF